MRLRLFIQRNRLPPTKIWWDTSSFEPGDDHNVSTLLSRVGQIVPMESGGWGLEDYAVEVDGFEVLHFQEVERVIREGDEVVIRPLTTTEVRQRRASGRRQISTSGRKLLDGTPFGRPMITTRPAPDRPRLSIPPRKRVKTGCNVDYSTLVQVGSDDESENDDESYEESDEEQEASEVDDEEEVGTGMEVGIEAHAESDEAEESDGEEEDHIDDADFEELSRDYENPLMDYFEGDEVESSRDSFPGQPTQLGAIFGARTTQSLQGQNGSLQGDSSEDDDDYTDSGSSHDRYRSDEGDSSENITDGGEGSMEVDIVGQTGDSFLPDYFYSDISAAGGAVDSPKLPQLYQSEDMSEGAGEDGRESNPEHLSLSESSAPPGPEHDRDSRSSSEDSSERQGFGESGKVGVSKSKRSSEKASWVSSTSQGPSPSRVPSMPIEQAKKLAVAPGTLPHQGNPGTKARNERKKQRRKNERLLAELVSTGVLPKGSTIDDLKQYQSKHNFKNADEQLRHRHLRSPAGGSGEKQTGLELPEELAAKEPPRYVADHVLQETQQGQQSNNLPGEGANKKGQRKKLRKAFTKAKKKKSVPADWDFSRWLMEREKKAGVGEQPNKIDVGEDVDGDVSMESGCRSVELSAEIPSKRTGVCLSQDQPPPPPPHREPLIAPQDRSRPRGPRKIVYDEDGVPNPVYAGFDEQRCEVEDPEAWRDKVVLSAVECEQEGVVIPTPEFPFKQPTYQPGFGWEATGNNKRKRNGGTKKRKQRQRDKENYGWDYGYQSCPDPGYGDWEGHDYYDDSTTAPISAQDKAADKTEDDPADDLPLLPDNIASLYPLTKPVLPGTIVAFKQLMLTEDYTPIMADYRTAIVQAVHAQERDGPALELRLAVRDRPKRRIDPETGEKILRKFEMPGDENEDEGFLDLMFGQLLEAKVVKLPEGAGLGQIVNGDASGGTDGARDTQEDNPDDQRNGRNVSHYTPEEADGYPPNIQVNATLSDELAPPSAEGSQDQEQDLELDLGPETQAAQPQESLKSPSPVDGVLGTAVFLSSAPTSQAEASVAPVFDNGESDPSYEPESVSDSDGLETLESMFASSQRIKPEPSSQRSPVLSPLPIFSPLGAGVEGGDGQSQRDIREEATNEKRTALKAIRTKTSNDAKITNSGVQIIDLTGTSDPIVMDDGPRARVSGRSRAKRKQWRAVKGQI
ncbi:hypothetical protein C7212DRAFT_204854 [Tuber magnatum]|uniref:DUF7357 domain-containing protein n=1 Tax=Tuber magnatum TaxID=42249 RepID=A0A317SMS7_9PEZI|nr:hypothetical protein C7212DRAFT_204854 [Tuber magnatum]